MRKLVLDLVAQRPVWRMPDWLPQRVRSVLDDSWELATVSTPTSSDGDGGQASHEAVTAVTGAEVYVGFGISASVFQSARSSLRWVHSAAAGVGGAIARLRGSDVQLTNSAGIHSEPIADWVLGAMVHFTRGIDLAVRAQSDERWSKDEFTSGERAFPELETRRVGIVGLGGVGTAVARRCLALGMEVRGVRRNPNWAAPGLMQVMALEQLPSLAEVSDVLVVALPATPKTEGIVNVDVLKRLPDDAIVINVSRGSCLNDRALLQQLDAGRFLGVALDVFAIEPLPPDHPYWMHPRVLVSPHVSATSERFWEREAALLTANIERYVCGKELLNVVDFDEGY